MPLKSTPISEIHLNLIPGEMTFPSEIEKEVAAIWTEEKKTRGKALTDGILFAIVNQVGTSLDLQSVRYRYFVAKLKNPDLFSKSRLRTLALSGLTRSEDTVLFGKRAKTVTQFPGLWELVPSGGIAMDAVTESSELSLEKQVYAELKEELGIEESAITSVRPFLFLENTDIDHFDIGVEVKVKSWKPTQPRTAEYEELRTVAENDILRFCKTTDVITASKLLLKAAFVFCKDIDQLR